MADNVTFQSGTLASPSAGVVISTDEGAGGQVQRVKLALSADGSETHISADANGLEVQGAGVAGTPAGGVMSVQGVASGTVLPVSDGGGSLTVDGTVGVSGTVTVDGSGVTQPVSHAALTELAAAINASSQLDVNIAASAATVAVSNAGLTELAAAINGASQMDVNLAASNATVTVTGTIAHDSADSGNPHKIGAKAIAHGANPTAVAAADRTDAYADRHGRIFVKDSHPNLKVATYITTGAGTDDNVLAAISAGTKYGITRISVTLDEATSVGVACRLGFGTANVPALGASQADAVDSILCYHPGLVPGQSWLAFQGDVVGGDGEELRITNEAPTSGTLAVSVAYYTIES